jgi:hypothetical protein
MMLRVKENINQFTNGLYVISTVRSLAMAIQEDVPFHTYDVNHLMISQRPPKLVDPGGFVRNFDVALRRK